LVLMVTAAVVATIGVFVGAQASLAVTQPTLTGIYGSSDIFLSRGGSAMFKGSGFTPGAAYSLSAPAGTINSADPATVTADSTGSFTATLSLPTSYPLSPSYFNVSAADQTSSVVATLPVEISQPTLGGVYCPGQAYTMQGGGFTDGTYSITSSDPSVTPSSSSVTVTHGALSLGYGVGRRAPSYVKITATLQGDPGGSVAGTLLLGPTNSALTTGSANFPKQATASCFAPGEKVDLVHSGSVDVPASVTASSTGAVSFPLTLRPAAGPTSWAPVQMTGEESGRTASVGGGPVPGTQFHVGQVLQWPTPVVSPDLRFVFRLQACDPEIEQLWPNDYWTWDAHAPSWGVDCQLQITPKGNLEAFKSDGTVVWASHTIGTSTGNYLTMRSDGNAAIYTATGALIWISGQWFVVVATGQQWTSGGPQPPPAMAHLGSGAAVHRGHYIRNGNTQFGLLGNGNVVVMRAGRIVWDAGVAGRGGALLTMRPSGNLVLTSATGRDLWTSNTYGRGTRDQVVVEPNGDVVILSSAGHYVWRTRTNI